MYTASIAEHLQRLGANPGWTWILSDLKTALESGERMAR